MDDMCSMCIMWTLVNNHKVNRRVIPLPIRLRHIFYGRIVTDEYRLTSFLVPSEVNRDKKPSKCHWRIPLPTFSDLNRVARTIVVQYSRGSYFVILTITACKSNRHFCIITCSVFQNTSFGKQIPHEL